MKRKKVQGRKSVRKKKAHRRKSGKKHSQKKKKYIKARKSRKLYDVSVKSQEKKKKLPKSIQVPSGKSEQVIKPPTSAKKYLRALDEESAAGDESTLDKTPMRIYLQQIENIPLLTPEEEVHIAKKIYHGGEPAEKARIWMIRSNLRLVISIAKRYANIGLPFSDLVEEGNIGLMRAVDKFNYKRGYRFSTYASWWIKQAIMRALSNQGKTIRVPVYMYDILSKWRKVRDGLTQKLGRAPTRKEISDAMEISIRKVKEVERIALQPSSLNAPVSLDGSSEVMDLIQDQSAVNASDNVHELFTSERVDRLLQCVDERSREILILRFGLKGGDPKTLEDTAKQFNITRERVRQIEGAALQKIRNYLKLQRETLQDYISA